MTLLPVYSRNLCFIGIGSLTVFSSLLSSLPFRSSLLHVVDRFLRDPGHRISGLLLRGYSHCDE